MIHNSGGLNPNDLAKLQSQQIMIPVEQNGQHFRQQQAGNSNVMGDYIQSIYNIFYYAGSNSSS